MQSSKKFPNSLYEIYDLPYKILKVAKSAKHCRKKNTEEIKSITGDLDPYNNGGLGK